MSERATVRYVLDNPFNQGSSTGMQLSDEAGQKISEACRAIQIILPFLAISSVIYLGVVFSEFEGPILLNKQPHRESLFFAGLAFFTATVLAPYFQRSMLAGGEENKTADQYAVSGAKKIQYSVTAASIVLVAAACINIAAFRTTKDAVNLVVVGLLLVAVLTRIPTQTGFRRLVDEFLSQRMGTDDPL